MTTIITRLGGSFEGFFAAAAVAVVSPSTSTVATAARRRPVTASLPSEDGEFV